MLLEPLGETVTLEAADGTLTDVRHVLCTEASVSDQTVMDVQTRFINQARYKGDSLTLNVWWPKSAPHDLMDAHIHIRGERYAVYGTPFPVANSPNGYDCRITCSRSLYLYDVLLMRVSGQFFDEWGGQTVDYEKVPAKANLLRLSETLEAEAAQRDLSRTVMFELEPGSWDEAYTAFSFDGRTHHIESVERARESVVIAGVREVTDIG
jgi:hypothetical protein